MMQKICMVIKDEHAKINCSLRRGPVSFIAWFILSAMFF